MMSFIFYQKYTIINEVPYTTKKIPITLLSFTSLILFAYLLAKLAPINAERQVMIKGSKIVPPITI